jgi:hypothetical protein
VRLYKLAGLFSIALLASSCSTPEERKRELDILHSIHEGEAARVAAKVQLDQFKREVLTISKNLKKVESDGITSDPEGSRAEFVQTIINKGGACAITYNAAIDEIGYRRFIVAVEKVQGSECKSVIVHLRSIGGSVPIGLKMGHLIRQLNFDTRVWAASFSTITLSCDSACTLAFLGGVKRFGPMSAFSMGSSGTGPIGVHQVSRISNNKKQCVRDPKDQVYSVLYHYFKEMAPDSERHLLQVMREAGCEMILPIYNSGALAKKIYTDNYSDEWYSHYPPPFIKEETNIL